MDDKTKLDAIGALRYTKLKLGMDVVVDFNLAPFGGALSVEGSNSWVDGVVGFRVIHPVSDEVALVGYADIGAGGSDLTYQVMGGSTGSSVRVLRPSWDTRICIGITKTTALLGIWRCMALIWAWA